MKSQAKYLFGLLCCAVFTITVLTQCSAPERSKVLESKELLAIANNRGDKVDSIVPSCQQHKSAWLCAHEHWDNMEFAINSNKRCDTIDILDYAISLDMTNIVDQYLSGNCELSFKPKMSGVKELSLDLLEMNIDSIVYRGDLLRYTYNDTILKINFEEVLVKEKEQKVKVYYNGHPQKDASWGGFYFDEGYAFNLGVGFDANPHNYGRVWYPCFDNFAERATYTFQIKTKGTKRAHCNGILEKEDSTAHAITSTWRMDDPIPSYLACIAVADYVVVRDVHKGLKGNIPIELVALPKDTTNLKLAFQHLSNAISAYEYWFGYHRWGKVGYSLVPFRSGAMEHATNITYPVFAVKDGKTRLESLMAHELAHSWWGNLVTCQTSGDMWINEGMASYSEALFLEYTYGWNTYINEVKNNHYKMLLDAHRKEGGYRPIAAVPHPYTYGSHVYDKGASVVHNMRWYMGDEAFRKGLQYIINEYQYKNINSLGFRDALTKATGLDLQYFFNDWVFGKGFPHFELSNYSTEKKGNEYFVNLAIHQRLLGRNTFLQKVPLQVSFLGANYERHQVIVEVSDELTQTMVTCPFEPEAVVLNEEHRLNQARIDQQLWCVRTGVKELKQVQIPFFDVKTVQDSAWVHLEYHPIAALGQLGEEDMILSTQRYWTINGLLPTHSFDAMAALKMQAKVDTILYQTGGEKDWILLYRANPQEPWQEHPSYTQIGLKDDVFFHFSVLKGDYAFGRGKMLLGHEASRKDVVTEVIIKQVNTKLKVRLKLRSTTKLKLHLCDAKGILMESTVVNTVKDGDTQTFNLPNEFKERTFFLKVLDKNDKQLAVKRVVL